MKYKTNKRTILSLASLITLAIAGYTSAAPKTTATQAKNTMNNRAVETGQRLCFNTTDVIDCPDSGEYFGQDAQFTGNSQSYTSHGNGTVSDNITGLMWTRSPDINGDNKITKKDKLSSSAAITYCESLDQQGEDDRCCSRMRLAGWVAG